MDASVGTDPFLALKTRRGTGYYKVPSLKGVWYRGPFEHWLVSGVGFAAHIAYGHFRLGNSPRTTAMHASIAAALGAGALAVAANLHEWMAASSYRPSIAIALVAWPLLTVVPAFVVAMVAAAVLKRWYPRSET